MDLVTLVAACAIGLRSDLFVPIGQRAQCTQAAVEAAPLINGTRRRSLDRWDVQIAAASRQFAVPVRLIRAVMRAESNGIATATSPAGAMGLMQLMPGTWADMRARYRLGDDPYAPADNILAGVAFLRELIDRYGAPDFLAAYNAGPGRVDVLRQSGVPLPAETRRYVGQLDQVARDAASRAGSDGRRTAAQAQVSGKLDAVLPQHAAPDLDRLQSRSAATALPNARRAQPSSAQFADGGGGIFIQLGGTTK